MITLSKEEIETQDYNQINHFIVSKAESKDVIMEYLQRFEICVDGYDKDPRELYEIPEFQVYACELIDSFPEIIWFLNLKAGFFPALAASYFNYYRKTVDKPLVEFMLNCFGPLNLMTNQFAIDNSYNSQVTDIFTNRLQELFVK
ncbi:MULTISPECIES: chlororespiratory reduction 6 domain-containing protein [Bacillus cereus group]|uniref:chlororespiratory reduction 6 domain-containing protein n=1 Tax=Bacillus cereus group TaxID=86661 RepID=UPI0030C88731